MAGKSGRQRLLGVISCYSELGSGARTCFFVKTKVPGCYSSVNGKHCVCFFL